MIIGLATRVACAVGLLGSGVFAPAVIADVVEDGCSISDGEKGDLCGHALAEIAQIGSALRLDDAFAAVATQVETDILHCFLDFEVLADATPKRIEGSNTLTVRSLADRLSEMTLDLASNMLVSSVTVDGAAAAFTRPGDQILIDLGAAYDAGVTFQVKVAYSGTPKNRTTSATGWSFPFFTTHGSGSQNRTIAASLSEPFYAHYWWPCKENRPNTDDKFTLDMHVTVPDWMVVGANGLLQGTDTLSGARKKFRWHESYPVATYLVAFGATNYAKQTWSHPHAGGAMPVEFYIYPESVSVSQPYLADIVQAIATYSDPGVFGPYPFLTEKYGIMQFQWNAGMEHQTMTSQNAFTTERRNVHELAHQWWGDAITCKTWHDIWLNEGFARYAEAIWQEKRPGGSYAGYMGSLNTYRPSTSGTGTVYRYDISTTSAIFSTEYVYNKGSWVLHMLRHVLGDAQFFAALAAYRSAHEGGVADTGEFQSAVEASSGLDLGWFFNQWVYQAGAPYYRYGWEPAQIGDQHYARLYIAQYQQNLATPLPIMRMPVDITVTTAGGTQTHVVWSESASQWYLLATDGPVTAVAFDKDSWILRGDAAVVPYLSRPPNMVGTWPLPGAQLAPGAVVDRVTLRFSEPVVVDPGHVLVTGLRTGVVTFDLSYESASDTATLTFPGPLPLGDTYTVRVSAGVHSVSGGVSLDGELSASGAGAFPSGDGQPGGDAAFSFYIPVPADFDLDRDVDEDDLTHLLDCTAGPLTAPQPACANADLDRDGDVDQSDFGRFQNCIGGMGRPPACW